MNRFLLLLLCLGSLLLGCCGDGDLSEGVKFRQFDLCCKDSFELAPVYNDNIDIDHTVVCVFDTVSHGSEVLYLGSSVGVPFEYSFEEVGDYHYILRVSLYDTKNYIDGFKVKCYGYEDLKYRWY